MAVLSEFPPRPPELGSLARVVDAETRRLCVVIESAADVRVRNEALAELKLLARNARRCIELMEPGFLGSRYEDAA